MQNSIKDILKNSTSSQDSLKRIAGFIRQNYPEFLKSFECWCNIDNIMNKMENKLYDNEKRDLDLHFLLDKFLLGNEPVPFDLSLKRKADLLKKKLYVFGNDNNFKFVDDPIDLLNMMNLSLEKILQRAVKDYRKEENAFAFPGIRLTQVDPSTQFLKRNRSTHLMVKKVKDIEKEKEKEISKDPLNAPSLDILNKTFETSISTIFNALTSINEMDIMKSKEGYNKSMDVTSELMMIDHNIDTREKFEDTLRLKGNDLIKYFSCWRDVYKYIRKLVAATLNNKQIVGYICYIVDVHVCNVGGSVVITKELKEKLTNLQKTIVSDKDFKNLHNKIGVPEMLLLAKEMEEVLGRHVEDWVELILKTKNDRKTNSNAHSYFSVELLSVKRSKLPKKPLTKPNFIKLFQKGSNSINTTNVYVYTDETKLIFKKAEKISIILTEFNISELVWDKDSLESQILFTVQDFSNTNSVNLNVVKLPYDFSIRFENQERRNAFLYKLSYSKGRIENIIKTRENDIKYILSQPLPLPKGGKEAVDIYTTDKGNNNYGSAYVTLKNTLRTKSYGGSELMNSQFLELRSSTILDSQELSLRESKMSVGIVEKKDNSLSENNSSKSEKKEDNYKDDSGDSSEKQEDNYRPDGSDSDSDSDKSGSEDKSHSKSNYVEDASSSEEKKDNKNKTKGKDGGEGENKKKDDKKKLRNSNYVDVDSDDKKDKSEEGINNILKKKKGENNYLQDDSESTNEDEKDKSDSSKEDKEESSEENYGVDYSDDKSDDKKKNKGDKDKKDDKDDGSDESKDDNSSGENGGNYGANDSSSSSSSEKKKKNVQKKIKNLSKKISNDDFNKSLSETNLSESLINLSEENLRSHTLSLNSSESPLTVKKKGEDEEEDPFTERGQFDWNAEFQEHVTALRNPYLRSTSRRRHTDALIKLAEDFVACAKRYGKIIISEVYLPLERKTIKPRAIGGIIGGEKYIVANFLFKFAVDRDYVFDGDHHYAAKVAGHELKGLKAFFSVNTPDLHFPLMALIDYRGFRLIASALLPLSKNSLKYGSGDGGRTIHRDNQMLASRIEQSSKTFNLKLHPCGPENVMMATCCDIEGHVGKDGRFYMLDFSRTFPCTSLPKKREDRKKGSHLFEMFRQEFVKSWQIFPLCSDAYSHFVKYNEGAKEHRWEVDLATFFLEKVTIPCFAVDLISLFDSHLSVYPSLSHFQLTQFIHSRGINMRYLGMVCIRMKNSPYAKIVMLEMVARIIKNELRAKLRKKMRDLELIVDEPYRNTIIDYLNDVFSKKRPLNQKVWEDDFVSLLRSKFNFDKDTYSFFPDNLRSYIFLPKLEVGTTTFDGCFYLYKRIEDMTGVSFDSNLLELLKTSPDIYDKYDQIFMNTDLIDMGDRVKHLDVVSNAKGDTYMFHAREKEKQRHLLGAEHLYKSALHFFNYALNSDPNDVMLLNNTAKVLQKLESINLCKNKGVESISELIDEIEKNGDATSLFSLNSPGIFTANNYYLRALRADNNNATTHRNYALFKERCGDWDEAEEHYIAALKIDPNLINALEDYSIFLRHIRKSKTDYSSFRKRAIDIRQNLSLLERKKSIVNTRIITRVQQRPSVEIFFPNTK